MILAAQVKRGQVQDVICICTSFLDNYNVLYAQMSTHITLKVIRNHPSDDRSVAVIRILSGLENECSVRVGSRCGDIVVAM